MTTPSESARPAPALPDGLTAPSSPGISEILPSIAANSGLPGYANTLGLPAVRRVVLVLVDGMGTSLLRRYAAHTPWLRSQADHRARLSTVFPSTTAAALTSLGTGLAPGEHGIVGYDVLAEDHPSGPRVVNQLGSWDPALDPQQWQPHPTLLGLLAESGLLVASISQPRFEHTALTQMSTVGGRFIPAKSIEERISQTVSFATSVQRGLAYVYFNEVDKAGHRHGVESDAMVQALEDIDFALKRLYAQLPEDTLLLITADHGMVDVSPKNRIDVSQVPELLEGVACTAGEPRLLQLYADRTLPMEELQESIAGICGRWQQFTGAKAAVLTQAEAVSAGLLGAQVSDDARSRLGDVLVLARTPVAYLDGSRVSEQAFDVVGQHGSLTPEETAVPLFVLPKVR